MHFIAIFVVLLICPTLYNNNLASCMGVRKLLITKLSVTSEKVVGQLYQFSTLYLFSAG